jgi:hypothetical protein
MKSMRTTASEFQKEYGRYASLATRQALSEADLDRLEQSRIPDETKKLDHLVPEKW